MAAPHETTIVDGQRVRAAVDGERLAGRPAETFQDLLDRGRDDHAELLAGVFTEVARVLKDDGRMTFTFHHANQGAWHHLQAAMIDSGFVVERWWPVVAEMENAMPIIGKEHNGHLDIVFVCAKRAAVAQAARQDSVSLMGRKLAAAKLPMVAADHRALLNAKGLQAATFAVAGNERSTKPRTLEGCGIDASSAPQRFDQADVTRRLRPHNPEVAAAITIAALAPIQPGPPARMRDCAG